MTEDACTVAIAADGSVSPPGTDGAKKSLREHAELLSMISSNISTTATKGKKTPVVVIAGDREAKWERIMQVWNLVRTAGVSQISFQVGSGPRIGP